MTRPTFYLPVVFFTVAACAFLFLSTFAGSKKAMAMSEELEYQIRQLTDSQIKVLARHPLVIESIKAQNEENSSLPYNEIEKLDKQWVIETAKGKKPLINEKLSTPLSKFLKEVKKSSEGLYTEIIAMDSRGLNVGQSDVTTDYWQGDEDKFRKTFLVGVGAVHVTDIYFDDSAQSFQVQVSVVVVDDGFALGVLTVGIDIEELETL